MNTQFQGIYAVVVTPFHEDGTFDFESAKKNLDWLIEQGVQGVCILGATGEYQSISDFCCDRQRSQRTFVLCT